MTEEEKYPPGKHPNQLAALRKYQQRWQKGQSGNPKGRAPKELTLTSLAREKLAESCPYAPDKTWAEYLVERWLGHAVENAVYFRELIERLEGKVLQPIGGEGGKDLIFNIVVSNEQTKDMVSKVLEGERTVATGNDKSI